MEIEVFDSSRFDEKVAEYIVSFSKDICARKKRCSIALSGGSTPKAIYALLGTDPLSSQLPWGQIDFLLGDERFVPLDDPRSNYRMAHETLGKKGDIALFPIDMSVRTVEESAEQYASSITKHVEEKKNGIPVIDLMLLGIGDDGHTASLFPGDIAAINEKEKLCVAVNHPSDGTQRVSMSKPLIQNATKLIFIAKGVGKKNILKEILEGSAPILTYPSRLFTEVSERTVFLLDTQAAESLSNKALNKN